MLAILKANPFPKAEAKYTYVIFLQESPPSNVLTHVSGQQDEQMRLGEREIFVHYANGMGRSKLRIPADKTGTARDGKTNPECALATVTHELTALMRSPRVWRLCSLQAGAPESALSATRSLRSSYAGECVPKSGRVNKTKRRGDLTTAHCPLYVDLLSGPGNRKENDMAKAIARRKRVIRRNWTRTEVKELRQHSKDRTRIKTIARALKRTPGALRQKARLLGIPLGHRRIKKKRA
jgi:hypothetical protein